MVSMSLILDRRVRDTNGHMHVADCIITRGIVSDYYACELDGAVERGYKPYEKISIYRDPASLKQSLESFKDIPLMHDHHIVSAQDPKKQHIIGTVSNPRMEGDDVIADLTFWSEPDGIDLVLLDGVDNLSVGYGSQIDWTPGEHNGLHYVARFHTINANHVALLPNGRVPGARVADQIPLEPVMTEKSKFPKFLAALATVLNLKAEQVTVIDSALEAEMGGTVEAPAITEPTEAEVAAAAEAKRLADEKIVADQAAVDAAHQAEIKAAVDAAEARVHALYAAREAVSDKVGITALDSAEATYRFALDKSGVNHASIVADALPALWEATNKKVIRDSAPSSEVDFSNVFSVSHIRKG